MGGFDPKPATLLIPTIRSNLLDAMRELLKIVDAGDLNDETSKSIDVLTKDTSGSSELTPELEHHLQVRIWFYLTQIGRSTAKNVRFRPAAGVMVNALRFQKVPEVSGPCLLCRHETQDWSRSGM